jgi:hypothetical protein
MPRGVPKAGFRNMNKNSDVKTVYSAARISAPVAPVSNETDEQIDKRLRSRFDIVNIMARSACSGATRSLFVSGPAGLGKSFSIEEVVKDYDPAERKTVIAKGFMRPTGLYKLLYAYRKPGNVIVFDDADSIFFDPDALNLIKAACDTTDRRRICWGAETRMTDDAGAPLPWSFDFEGSIIFITNYDFDWAVNTGHRLKEHFEALISRSHYIDTGMKSVRDYLIRIKQVVEGGMLRDRGFRPDEEKEIVEYVMANHASLRELTLRIVIKLAGLYRAEKTRWKDIAKVTLHKNS